MRYIKSINEKRPKGSPKWHDADWPDAEGRFKDLSPKDLAAWLIKTRKGDMSAISGSLTQQVVFSRKKDPEHAEKMEKTRKEVYKQMDRKDLLDKMDESVLNEAEETYNDYPAAAKKNAQMAIDWKEKYGREEVDAGTAVGWARAHQLAKGEKISADTISRMASFNRHRKNSKIAAEYKDTPWKDRGYVAWLIWGGDEGVDWAMKKSKELDKMEESNQMKNVKSISDFQPINEGVETLIDVLINAGWLSLFFAGSVAYGDVLGFRKMWKNNRLRKQAIKKMADNPKIMKAAKAEDLQEFGYLMTTTLTDDELSAISFDDMKSGKTMRQVGGMSESKYFKPVKSYNDFINEAKDI